MITNFDLSSGKDSTAISAFVNGKMTSISMLVEGGIIVIDEISEFTEEQSKFVCDRSEADDDN